MAAGCGDGDGGVDEADGQPVSGAGRVRCRRRSSAARCPAARVSSIERADPSGSTSMMGNHWLDLTRIKRSAPVAASIEATG